MEKLIHGLWGCFFGMTVVMLMGSLVAYSRSLHRISLNAALTALMSAFYVVAFLGVFQLKDPDALARFLAHLTTLIAGFLVYQSLNILGMLKSPNVRERSAYVLMGLCGAILAVSWIFSPFQALAFCLSVNGVLAIAALAFSIRIAMRGERLGRVMAFSVLCIFVAFVGLALIALNRGKPLLIVHVITAGAATLYLASVAFVIWMRYAYLIELHEVMAHGPSYDPVTQMRSHQETGQMVGSIFKDFRDKPSRMGVVVLTIANLYALEQLHGVAAVNNAFFVCAARLRRWVPRHIEMGRLGADGFLLIMQNCTDSKQVIDLARALETRLHRSVTLNTSRDVSQLGSGNTEWVAEIGVGVLMIVNPESRGTDAIVMARRLARTAVSYASRIAWFDHSSGETVELPVLQARA